MLEIQQWIFHFDRKRSAHLNKLFKSSVEQLKWTLNASHVFVWDKERVRTGRYSTFQWGLHPALVLERGQCFFHSTTPVVSAPVLTPTLIDSPGLLIKVIGVWFSQGQGLGGRVWDWGPVKMVCWEGGAVWDNRGWQAGLSRAARALLGLPLLQHL